ncbi:hypothetical protein CSUI_003364 [Cystoisospora suis]|uniref:Uncharacterized protein n=1 Tax=Cystoisospora suis TaxID=483139 RepID=A0A2C6L558_9APIC|nr:hypothetical protein CSUI_003364 [Cystoisospora suis]
MAQGHAPEKEKAASSKVEEKSSRDEETAGLVKEENEEKSPEEQERIDKILSSMRKLSSSYSETELLRLLEDYIGEVFYDNDDLYIDELVASPFHISHNSLPHPRALYL